jgi:hypothetical protein
MNEREFDRLKQDIKDNGLLEDIELYENKIIDGRNRYKACLEVGVTPRFKEFEGENTLKYVISKNLHRRHLNESQRGLVASRLANLNWGQRESPIGDSISRKQASEMLNVGSSTIDRIREIEQKKPEEIQRIERGEVSAGRIYGELKREEAETPEWLRYLDVWNFKENTGDGLSNLPPEILKNLFYYYTQENDLIFDPFAGSGLTYKIAKEMGRKCVTSDINPKENFVIKWNVDEGFENFPDKKLEKAKMIFLDPPYWKMVHYDDNGWSNTSLSEFYEKFERFVSDLANILDEKGFISLIIMPMKVKGDYIDLGFECYKILQKYYDIEQRLCVPLSRNWAFDKRLKESKEKREILTSSLRDLIIFKKKTPLGLFHGRNSMKTK